MAFILCFITSALSIIITVAIVYFTSFDPVHFSLFFILPAGSLFIGALAGSGYFYGLKYSEKKINAIRIFIGIALSLLCLFSLEYTKYKMTCLDYNAGTIYYSFSSKDRLNHISNYSIDGYGDLTFLNFKKFDIENSSISFESKYHQDLGGVSDPKKLWFFAIIDFAGLSLGFLYFGILLRRIPYCSNCKRYKLQHTLAYMNTPLAKFFIENVDSILQSKDSFNEFISVCRSTPVDSSSKHIQGRLLYCNTCSDMQFALIKFNYKSESNPQIIYIKNISFNLIESFVVKNQTA